MAMNPPRRPNTRGNVPAPPTQVPQKPSLVADPNKENARLAGTGTKDTHLTDSNFELFHEELEKKYDIEGSNILDIVYARRENDEAQAKITAQQAELEALRHQVTVLSSAKQKSMKAKAKPTCDVEMTANPQIQTALKPRTGAGTATDADAMAVDQAQGDETAAEALARENAELKRLLAAAQAGAANDQTQEGPAAGSIHKPAGTAGTNYNIRDAMGLGKTERDGQKYKGIQRSLRDLTHQGGVNWEKQWSDISAEVKGKIFAARERHPILARFHNDWATEDIIKQYIKNKRGHAYRNEWLEVPAKYNYLKANAAKRNPSAPRGRQNKLAKVRTGKKTRVAKNKAGASGSGRKSSSASLKKAKGKAKAVVPDDSEEDEEMAEEVEEEDEMDEDDN
ncbi:hypothetical protein MVEN_01462800 [Mycena venus]|uniref:Uncharacterized protein n=1 Tax=Mycena venus TaxID=2733690 RepID=A0A8H6XS77_9AGAR|nr:hypothetical protein MVEN_01462800 [Mycena venus]